MSKPRVVIVGAGFGGCAVAKLLDSDFEVVLLEKKDTFFYNVASLRGVVEEGFAEKLFIPYDKLLKKGKLVKTEVSEITKDEVICTNEDIYTFDYLIIALGTSYPEPFKVNSSSSETKTIYGGMLERLKSSEKVLIVGAGSVGLELAGEIATDYPKKEVTVVGKEFLKDTSNQKFKDKAKFKLEKELNVKLILGERLQIDGNNKEEETKEEKKGENTERKIYTTDKGTIIEADILFNASGSQINNEPLKKNFSDVIEEGRLKVNEFLQVQGYENIFAIGDITNTKEVKLGYIAGLHAKIAAANIKSLSQKKTKLKAHVIGKPGMFLSLGRNNGVGFFNNFVFGGKVVKTVKSKTLFVNKTWESLNQKPPK